MQIEDAEPMGAEIRNGPIWTQVEASSFQGSRSESPEIDRSHVEFVDRVVKRVMTNPDVKERLDFAGQLKESDIFTDTYSDMTVTSFVRHPEDFISIRFLDEVIDVLQPQINENPDLTMRDYRGHARIC